MCVRACVRACVRVCCRIVSDAESLVTAAVVVSSVVGRQTLGRGRRESCSLPVRNLGNFVISMLTQFSHLY